MVQKAHLFSHFKTQKTQKLTTKQDKINLKSTLSQKKVHSFAHSLHINPSNIKNTKKLNIEQIKNKRRERERERERLRLALLLSCFALQEEEVPFLNLLWKPPQL